MKPKKLGLSRKNCLLISKALILLAEYIDEPLTPKRNTTRKTNRQSAK